MSLPMRLWFPVYLLAVVFNGVLPRQENRRTRKPEDWDMGWSQFSHREAPDYEYESSRSIRPAPSPRQGTRALLVTHQKGSVTIPHTRSTVHITPLKEVSHKLYKGRIKATVFDRPKKRDHYNQRLRHGEPAQELWQYSQDQPPTAGYHQHPCVRCPRDQAVLAPKGSISVLMDTPPIIPCYPWSSVEKVKSEILAGPQPGTKMAEGSHKILLHLYRHKRSLAKCVIRYNVIVRKCPELELSSGVKADCPLGKAWGSRCNLTCGLGYLLEGDSSTECSDDLEWTGIQPQCISSTACPVPVGLEKGQLSCRTPQHKSVPLQGASMLPDGTVCHFRCQPGYIVPPEQTHLTRMRCIAGSWDSDQDPVCVETNELEEEEELRTDISVDDALRLDGKDCPENFCLNGGMCLTILNEPMCSCQPGYSGPHCEDEDAELEPRTESDDNTIT